MSAWVLAFDTATEALAVAVGIRTASDVQLVATHDETAPRQAMSRLLPTVDQVLADAGRGVVGVEELVVGRGPGSFTGVRIGVSTAKGLAFGLGAPLHGLGTLDAVAWANSDVDGLLGVVGDAMRGEVYPALFRVSGGRPERLSPDRVAAPEVAAATWAELGEGITLVGNGLVKHSETFRSVLGERATIADDTEWLPTGVGLLRAYGAAREAGEAGSGDPGAVLPVYTRLSDAEYAERARAGGAGGTLPPSGVKGPGGAP